MNTQPDMWHGKPERPDRTTQRQTLDAPRRRPPTPVWPKIVLLVLLMFGFIWAMKLLIGW
ncbi:MAG: hypothetical protein ABWZ88_03710 [Variovorax sp.]